MEVTVKGINVYYETYGSGMPILMLHGWSPDHRLMKGCMEPILQTLDASWQRIYFDLPGMGRTKGDPWITGSDQMLEVVLGFVDAIIPGQRFVVAGESYGGYLARGVVNKRLSDVEGVLLICPVANEETRLANVPEFRVLEEDNVFMECLSEEERQYFSAITVRRIPRVWQRFKEEILPGLKLADHDFLTKYLGQKTTFSFEVDQLEVPFDKPTLMLTGRQDSVVGYQDLWKIIKVYPRATFAVLDKAGHNAQIEQDVLFDALVKEWLERIVSERG
jgi:pimeloyl-ACP methyl ester carboxylesterase